MQKIRHISELQGLPGSRLVTHSTSMILVTVAALGVAACAESPPPGAESPEISVRISTDCVAAGSLRTDLSIGIRANLDWGSAEMSCEGMRRPADAGARLRFSGPYENGEEKKTLTLILGIPALEEAQIGAELPTNVTLVEEGCGRFFATPDTNGCWTDVTEHEHINGNSSQDYMISGSVFCVSPLAELNGSASVAFTELAFTRRVNWKSQ